MKKTVLLLAFLLLISAFTPGALADEGGVEFKANVTITAGADATTVTVEDSAALAQYSPVLTVACTYEKAYVTFGGATIDSTLDTTAGKISFAVSAGGVYTIVEVEPLEEPDAAPVIPGPTSEASEKEPEPAANTEAAPKATVDETGTATAEVSAETMRSLIENAKTAAGKEDAGEDAPTVVIKPNVTGDASKVAVELPSASVSELAEGTSAALAIETDLGKVSIPNDALVAMAEQAGSESISVSVEKAMVEDVAPEALEELTATVDAAVLEEAVIVKIDIKSGDKNVTSFGSAVLTLELPVSTEHKEGKTYLVLAVSDDGTVSRMTGKVVNGVLRVTTTHLTTFIATTEEAKSFKDIKESDYYYDAVLWASALGITNGTGEDTFGPEETCTRCQVVTFLWRAAGSPKATAANPFADVKEDAYYYDAVIWAIENHITEGTSAATFSPDETVTRAQFVTFLYRYAGRPAVTGEMKFTDVNAGEYFTDAVKWAAVNSVTSGTSDTTFSPAASCARGQTVTFLYRYISR